MLARAFNLARFFYHQRVTGFTVPDEPHLDPETLAWFAGRLGKARSYMEFGAGGSTRLAGRLGVPTISVEGDPFFARAVRKGLAPGHRVDLIDAGIGTTIQWGVPLRGSPAPQRVSRWRRYIDLPFQALQRDDRAFPDLVLVDGRFRRACALRTAAEAKGRPCDLLFDDYYGEGRDHYHDVERVLGSPRRIGRSALFAVAPDIQIAASEIDAAIADFR